MYENLFIAVRRAIDALGSARDLREFQACLARLDLALDALPAHVGDAVR